MNDRNAMNADGIWRSFVETGDPVCYLLAKKLERLPRRNDSHTQRPGESPRPSD